MSLYVTVLQRYFKSDIYAGNREPSSSGYNVNNMKTIKILLLGLYNLVFYNKDRVNTWLYQSRQVYRFDLFHLTFYVTRLLPLLCLLHQQGVGSTFILFGLLYTCGEQHRKTMSSPLIVQQWLLHSLDKPIVFCGKSSPGKMNRKVKARLHVMLLHFAICFYVLTKNQGKHFLSV